jgi:hypothetical protein
MMLLAAPMLWISQHSTKRRLVQQNPIKVAKRPATTFA